MIDTTIMEHDTLYIKYNIMFFPSSSFSTSSTEKTPTITPTCLLFLSGLFLCFLWHVLYISVSERGSIHLKNVNTELNTFWKVTREKKEEDNNVPCIENIQVWYTIRPRHVIIILSFSLDKNGQRSPGQCLSSYGSCANANE